MTSSLRLRLPLPPTTTLSLSLSQVDFLRMLYSFSSRPSSLSTSSPLSRRGVNRLYSRIGLWTIIVVCLWLYIQGSSTPKGRRLELVTGRKAEASFLKKSHGEHLQVSELVGLFYQGPVC